MKAAPMHADVWLIEQDQALLLRQHNQQWVEELRLPYGEFHGSAVALSSFSMPETIVYLNVFQNQELTQSWAAHRWAGIAQDPLRIIEVDANSFHQQVQREISRMGKKVHVIFASKPAQFARGISMELLNSQEFKLLKKSINSNKTGSSEFVSGARLYWSLYLNPQKSYQVLRSVAVVCLLATFLVMSWNTKLQQSKHDKATAQLFQNSINTHTRNSPPAPFTDWLEQMRKFGSNERANLVSLKMSWNEQGEVLSNVDLDRDRKRVPKACTLNNPRNAQCSIGVSGE